MSDIPLHVRDIITQVTISGELNSLNYTVIMLILHLYPCCVILWPISISSTPHVLLVQLIKI